MPEVYLNSITSWLPTSQKTTCLTKSACLQCFRKIYLAYLKL